MITVLRWERKGWQIEIRRHEDRSLTCHCQDTDSGLYENMSDARGTSLLVIAKRVMTGDRVADFVAEMLRARKEHFDYDPRQRGVYVGDENNFGVAGQTWLSQATS